MNVCMIAYTFYDIDNRVRRYAETLAQMGHKVDFVGLNFGEQPDVETIEGVTVHRIQTRVLNEKTKWSYLLRISAFFIRSFLFVTRSHFRKKYSLVHVHSVPDFEVFAALVPRLLGVPVILDIHDLVPEFFAAKFHTKKKGFMFKTLLLVEKLSICFCSHVIISNHLWEKTLISRSVKPKKITTIINYPDPSVFKPIKHQRRDGRFIIIYPGTLNWHQGVDLGVKAFDVIKKDFPQAEFHIYGEGPERITLERMVASIGLKQRILFKGLLNRDEVAVKMANADLGLVPKRADSFGNEAFSTKTLEFMLLGVPVLISETAVDRYYFNDNIAMFFRAGDVDDLASKMGDLINDRTLRQKLGKNATVFAGEINWEKKSYLYLDIFDRLTRSKS